MQVTRSRVYLRLQDVCGASTEHSRCKYLHKSEEKKNTHTDSKVCTTLNRVGMKAKLMFVCSFLDVDVNRKQIDGQIGH